MLRGNIMLRKNEMYLDPETEKEKNELVATGRYADESLVDVFHTFYGKFHLVILLGNLFKALNNQLYFLSKIL